MSNKLVITRIAVPNEVRAEFTQDGMGRLNLLMKNPCYGKGLTIEDYNKFAVGTRDYPKSKNIDFPILGLNGESGELAEKLKKVYRDTNYKLNDDGSLYLDDDQKTEFAKELGDVLWYITNCANDLGMSLTDVMELNIDKIAKRLANGTIHGSGDNR